MSDIIIIVFSSFGALVTLLAAVGLVKMPDTYLRISVNTKAATMGAGFILISAAVYFSELAITFRVLAIILFLLLTAPIGGHLIARATYFIGIKMWDKSVINELEGKYKKSTHELRSEDDDEEEAPEEKQ